jgi:hypothetical protein
VKRVAIVWVEVVALIVDRHGERIPRGLLCRLYVPPGNRLAPFRVAGAFGESPGTRIGTLPEIAVRRLHAAVWMLNNLDCSLEKSFIGVFERGHNVL